MYEYDYIVIGDLVSEKWLQKENIKSVAIGKMYNLNYRPDLTAQSPSVKNTGTTDTSNVYEVVVPVHQTYGSLDVAIQDQYTDLVDYLFCRNIRTLTLAIPAVINTYTLTVVSATEVLAGNYVCMQEGKRAFQARIVSIADNVLTLDTPLDYDFSVLATIAERSPNMNVNGSVTPVSFVISPIAGVKWDVTRILFQMILSTSGSDALFGNITALTKGIVLRKTDGVHHTIFNAKTNGDLSLRMYDMAYTDRATPTQSYGLRGVRRFNGLDANGVVIRLDGDNNERLELLVQDDLTGLTGFRMVAQGHIVE